MHDLWSFVSILIAIPNKSLSSGAFTPGVSASQVRKKSSHSHGYEALIDEVRRREEKMQELSTENWYF